jgi:quercetin dioxygenase-like cupin family protein
MRYQVEVEMRHVVCTVAATIALAAPCAAQDAVTSNPEVYRVVFENAGIRILSVNVKAGAKTSMHEHPDNVIVALSDAKVRFTGPDGKSEEAGLKADQAMWSPAGRHRGENLEQTPVQVVLVELKGTKAPTATIPMNRVDMKTTPLFDNPRAAAYRATTAPGFHEPAGSTHDFDQVVIALGDSDEISVNVEGKAKTQWKRGDALFIGRGMKHESKNSGTKPLDVIIVGIK